MPSYILFIVPTMLPGLAVVIAVCRANRDDLPAIVRALKGKGTRDDELGSKTPPSLPNS